jgi:hypothetical protein
LSFNDFEGALPEVVLQLPSLFYCSIYQNPKMRASLPPNPQTLTVQQYDTYYCNKLFNPQITFDYDDSYFNYELCKCDAKYVSRTHQHCCSTHSIACFLVASYYGSPPDNCMPCIYDTTCNGGASVTINSGTFPICDTETCGVGSVLLGVEHCHGEDHQCIPEGTCEYIPELGMC